MCKKIILFLPLFLIFTGYIEAQNKSFGLNFMLGFPQAEFKENVDRVGFGLSGEFVFTPNNSLPLSFGINVGYLNYGSETRRERFSATIPDILVEVDRTNNLVNSHLLARFGPVRGLIRPYFEALLGGSYIFTETSINDDYGYSEKIASNTNFEDWAWSYGGGGGVSIYLTRFDNPDNPQIGVFDLFLDLKIRYLYGSRARYMKEGSVKIIDGFAYYDIYESKTDILTFQLGVSVCF